MNYELAKKLKDAGFPQHSENVLSHEDLSEEGHVKLRSSHTAKRIHVVYDSSCGETLEYLKQRPVEAWYGKGRATIFFSREYLDSEEGKYLTAYRPALSELIAECGEKLMTIERKHHGWEVVGVQNRELVFAFDTDIEVSMAKLWLALNKK